MKTTLSKVTCLHLVSPIILLADMVAMEMILIRTLILFYRRAQKKNPPPNLQWKLRLMEETRKDQLVFCACFSYVTSVFSGMYHDHVRHHGLLGI